MSGKEWGKMSKELITCVIIIIVIVGLDILIGNFVDSKMDYTIELLQDVRTDLEKEDYSVAREKIDKINDYWYDSQQVFSFYIEHDELEKVATELTALKTYVELEEKEALEKIDIMAFIIKHIEEKDDLRLKNIF